MEVVITTEITRDFPQQNVFRVIFTVTDAVNILPEVFVYDTKHDVFKHVATVFDLEKCPRSRHEALKCHAPYYLRSEAVTCWNSICLATNFENITRSRLNILARTWAKTQNQFPGSTTFVASGA